MSFTNVLLCLLLQSCDIDHIALKARDVYHLTLYRKNSLTPEVKSNFLRDERQEEAHLTVIFWDMSLSMRDFSWALRGK